MNVSLRHENSPIPGHFIIGHDPDDMDKVCERASQHLVSDTDGNGKVNEYVCIGFEHAAKIICALMVRIEGAKNPLDKARAEEGLDQICGLLGSLGVISNLGKIRQDVAILCPECVGLSGPGTAFINADIVAMAAKLGISPGKTAVGKGV